MNKKLIPMPPHVFYVDGKPQNPWMQGGGEFDFSDSDYEEFKYGGIHIAKNKRGTFTAAATKHGQGVQEFARHVLANPDKFSPAMRKKANFARNAAGWNKQFGGDIVEGDYEDNFDNPFFEKGGPTPEQAKMINRAVSEKKLFGNAKPTPRFQMGAQVPQFKNPQQFHDYYGKQLGYKLVPGAKMEYYNPNMYSPTSATDRLAPWTAMNNAPLSSGNYPQQTFGYDSASPSMNFKQATPTIDSSKNPYQQVGFGKNPVYIDKNTGQPVPASVVMQQRQAQLNPNSEFKDGGAFLKALVKHAYKDVMRGGGQFKPSITQGTTGEEFLQDRNNTFKSYLSNNALRSIAMEEIDNLQQLHQAMKAKCGGMYQEGGEPDEQTDESYWNNLQGYNGAQDFSNTGTIQTPKFNFTPLQNGQSPITSQMTSDQLAGQQSVTPQRSDYDLMSNDMQEASFQQPQEENETNSDWLSGKGGYPMAEGIIAGLNFGSSLLNAKNTRSNENLLKQRMSADNIFMSNQYGSANRGQYETNSGMFRPNQNTFAQNRGNMKFGGALEEGEYLTNAEILRLKKAGYIVEFLD